MRSSFIAFTPWLKEDDLVAWLGEGEDGSDRGLAGTTGDRDLGLKDSGDVVGANVSSGDSLPQR
jgi:hypothetical protein